MKCREEGGLDALQFGSDPLFIFFGQAHGIGTPTLSVYCFSFYKKRFDVIAL